MADEKAIGFLGEPKLPSRSPDWAIAGLADRQHGVVARRQLLELGLGEGAIKGRQLRGILHGVRRGVYAVGRPGLSIRGRWMAAVLAAGPDAVLSHRSAAALWGLLQPPGGPIEVIRPHGLRPRRPGIRGYGIDLPADEVSSIDGIPVTSSMRTLFDLASVVPMRRLERALGEAEAAQLRDRVSLRTLLERYPGHRGVVNLRVLVERGAPGITREELEERFLAFLERADLPRPRLNAPLSAAGRFFEIDCLWGEERLAIELDGYETHGTRRRFETDRERDRVLLGEGWRVARVTWLHLHEEPEALARDLRRLLGARDGN